MATHSCDQRSKIDELDRRLYNVETEVKLIHRDWKWAVGVISAVVVFIAPIAQKYVLKMLP